MPPMRARRMVASAALAVAIGVAASSQIPAGGRGLSPSPAAKSGDVLIVTVHVSTSDARPPLFRIDGLQVVRGTLPGRALRSLASVAGEDAGLPDAPAELLMRDRDGRVLYREPFTYPRAATIPPLPPGEPDDGLPAVLPLEEQDVALALPYLAGVHRVEVRDVHAVGPPVSRVLSDEDRRLPDGSSAAAAEPAAFMAGAVAVPGSLSVLIVASGYLPAEMERFRARAGAVRDKLLATEPFAAQRASVRVSLHENTGDLACAPGCAGIDRLLCCSTTRVLAAAVASGAPYDEIVVVHNTSTYSGFGYLDRGGYKTNSYATASGVYDGPWSAAMAVHEFGHSFGDLCDEYALEPSYSYSPCVNCRSRCDELQDASACNPGCDVKPDYVRPEASIMLSLSEPAYNRTSIESTFSPDGLRMRLSFFTGAEPGTGASGQFPPRDQVLVFRETLEAYYRDTLRRGLEASVVDVEGEAVWIPEYLRYRLTQCTHDGAIQRVLAQIAGYGVQPGCGDVSSDYAFPPRDQTLAFRIELEQVYRDDLGRAAGFTSVDIEGSAVWLQEYLRYRLHGCPHGQASTKVLLQIQGQGVQPVCW